MKEHLNCDYLESKWTKDLDEMLSESKGKILLGPLRERSECKTFGMKIQCIEGWRTKKENPFY